MSNGVNLVNVPGTSTQMDPHLQKISIAGKLSVDEVFLGVDEGRVPVIARIRNLSAWEGFPNLGRGATIPDGNEWIVTGRIRPGDVGTMRTLDGVISLKLSRFVHTTLAATQEVLGLSGSGTPITSSTAKQGGEGVVMGVVDYGADFVHRNFRDAQGRSRIVSIWDQGNQTAKGGNSSYGYGRVFSNSRIDQALESRRPYSELGYHPGTTPRGTHGTHVMDIAAGSGPVPGVAPKSEFVFVQLASLRKEFETELTTDFGDSVRLVEAVDYIFKQAGEAPCVVNLSLGTNGGPHDGTNPAERAFDALVKAKPSRAVVIAASNSYEDGIHRTGRVTRGSYADVTWNISPQDPSHNEIEIWYSGKDEFSFELLAPNMKSIHTYKLGENGNLDVTQGSRRQTVAFISHRKSDPNNGDHVFHFIQETSKFNWGGQWTIRIHGRRVVNGTYHAWVERDSRENIPGAQSNLINDEKTHTLGSISSGHKSIVVGSFDGHKRSYPLSYFSSAGPTRDGRRKPEVSAPGHAVVAAKSLTRTGTVQMSGTSMAAPAVSGIIARMFGWALYRYQQRLPIDVTRELLVSSCQAMGGMSAGSWHPRYGFGPVSIDVLNKIDQMFNASVPRPITTGAPGVHDQNGDTCQLL